MKVQLYGPRREVEVTGPATVSELLDQLEISPESVLVIRDGTLVPSRTPLADGDAVEIRPVISGGA